MVRTQIQLPDEVYARAKRFCKAREMSLAELARRGVEMVLDVYPTVAESSAEWTVPEVDAGGVKVPLERVRDVLADGESGRSLKEARP
jgi:hypothetical protein